MIDNNQLDNVRLLLIKEYEPKTFYIWHREYKDYSTSSWPTKGDKVIVVEFRCNPYIYTGSPSGYSKGLLSGYIPFIYKGIPIKLWK